MIARDPGAESEQPGAQQRAEASTATASDVAASTPPDAPPPLKRETRTARRPGQEGVEDDDRQVGGYRLLTRLGGGGMGEVYLAEHRSGQRVALKLLPSATVTDPLLRRRFEREGRILLKLEHPAIVSVVDHGIDPRSGRPWLAMELLAGRDLGTMLEARAAKQLSVPETAYVLARCAEALAAAHARGVIHRDVKPANLLLTPNGEVKLTDFGLALSQDASARLTLGEVLGTPAYLAPEVLLGEAWSYGADMYALGAVAFRALAGRPLFEGQSATDVMCDQITRPPPPLTELRSEVPATLAALVARLLDKDPANRPTAEQAARELAELAPGSEALQALWSEAAVELPRPDSGAMALGPARRLRSGQTFLHYRIEEEIGRGGMGVVYRAWHFGLKRMVALKVLLAGALATDADRRRFLREAQAAGDLSHPGIVPVLDAGEHDGTYYITMAYVEGTPLGKWLEAAPPREARLALFVRVCEAVQHAHTRGVIHRDLKPDNVLVSGDGHPCILDFGVAKRLDQDEEHTTEQTTQGSLLGTLRYMAPEQAAGNPREVDVRSDVWSLGTILYEMLCGQTPFRGTLRELLHQLHFGEVGPPSKVAPEVAWELDAICLKALERDKEARYQSALELMNDLERYLQGLPILARRATRWYLLRKWVARNSGRVIAGSAALGLVVLLAGGWASSVAASRSATRARVIEQASLGLRALSRESHQEALDRFNLARELIGPEEALEVPPELVPLIDAQGGEERRGLPRITSERLREWAGRARRKVQRGEASRLLGEVRRMLDERRLTEAGQAMQLASRLSDEEDVQALAREVAGAFLGEAQRLEAEGGGDEPLPERRARLDQVQQLLEEAQRIDGRNQDVRARLAVLYGEQGKLEELEQAAALRVQAGRLVEQGQRSLEAEDVDGARRAFEQALGFDGSSSAAREGLLLVERAMAARREQERQRADQTRAAELVLDGRRALAAGDLEAARTGFTQALGFDGTSKDAQAGLVEIYRINQEREEAREGLQRQQRLEERLADAQRLLEEARGLFRKGELPERIRERYFSSMEALREALYQVPGHPTATRRLQEVARELSLVLVDQGYPELAGFILRVGGVTEDGPVQGELPRDPLLTVVETDQAWARQVFGRVYFLPSPVFDRLREYVRSQTDKLSFVIEVRSEIVQTGVHPQMFLKELRVKMENKVAGTWTPPEVVKLDGGPFLRPVAVDSQGRRVVRPWEQSHGLDPKPAIKQVEGIVQRLVRDNKHLAERAEQQRR